LIGVAGILAGTDAATDGIPLEEPWFSANVGNSWLNKLFSKQVGMLALAVAIFLTVINPELSATNKIIQVLINIAAFMFINFMVSALMASVLPLFAGIFISIFFALALSFLVLYINTLYFSFIYPISNPRRGVLT
jgi:hypothetical protein